MQEAVAEALAVMARIALGRCAATWRGSTSIDETMRLDVSARAQLSLEEWQPSR